MKIYKTASNTPFNIDLINKSTLVLTTVSGSSYTLCDSKLEYEQYGLEELGAFYTICGLDYRKAITASGSAHLVQVNKEKACLEIPEIIKTKLLEINWRVNINRYFSTYVRDYPDTGVNSILLYDMKKKVLASKAVNAISKSIFGDFLYGYDYSSKEVFKLNMQLECLWSYSPNFSPKGTNPIYQYKNTLITFIGPKEKKRSVVNGERVVEERGGILIALNDSDGSVCWELSFPNAVDEFKIINNLRSG